jgi:Flp pilus assembly protein TadB
MIFQGVQPAPQLRLGRRLRADGVPDWRNSMKAFLGTVSGGGLIAALAAGGIWTAIAVAGIVVVIVIVVSRLIRWVLDSDDRTRRAKDLLGSSRRGDSDPSG